MFELRAENAAEYLGYPCSAVELGGGVSNTVLLIQSSDQRFILKQSLGKLRVEQDWFSDRSRIFRESSAMRQLAGMLPRGSVPDIIFEDRENFIFAMTAAPSFATPWKDVLLAGHIDASIAAAVGDLLGAIISASWENSALKAEFGDQTIFDELRLDPYYRSTAKIHADLAAHFRDLMDKSANRRASLVHGDWSPKNLLVSDKQVMAIDFEVVHFGDPSFDAAFILNHLMLKSFLKPEWMSQFSEAALRFWSALTRCLPAGQDWFEASTVKHLGCLLLARMDGKSPAEYIRDPALKATIRAFARGLIVAPPKSIDAVFTRASDSAARAQSFPHRPQSSRP